MSLKVPSLAIRITEPSVYTESSCVHWTSLSYKTEKTKGPQPSWVGKAGVYSYEEKKWPAENILASELKQERVYALLHYKQ